MSEETPNKLPPFVDTRSVLFKGSGHITISLTTNNVLVLNARERKLIFDLLDLLDEYEDAAEAKR